jgi:hypothetical protein
VMIIVQTVSPLSLGYTNFEGWTVFRSIPRQIYIYVENSWPPNVFARCLAALLRLVRAVARPSAQRHST